MNPEIAPPQEVLETLTAVMRGPKTSEALKAAEQLGKHYGILTPKEGGEDKRHVAEEIEKALRAMKEEKHGP